MLFLADNLLKAAGFKHDEIEGTWVAPVRLPPVVTVQCDEDGAYITETMLQVHDVLDSLGCTYCNFAVRGGYLSLVGLTREQLAAVA
jgi:hypothetical protein